MRSTRTQPIQQHSNKAAESTVTVVHPQIAWITIPVLPGQTEAYTDAPILRAKVRDMIRKNGFNQLNRARRVLALKKLTWVKPQERIQSLVASSTRKTQGANYVTSHHHDATHHDGLPSS